MSRRAISVVIPVRDEQPEAVLAIQSLLVQEKWHNPLHTWESIVVDDGSRSPFPGATIRFPTPRGYGVALKAGIRHAQGEWVVTADGDGQHRWQDIQRLVKFMEEFPENAMVIGDRRVKETSRHRWIGRRCLNMLASAFAWRWIPDLNSGLRCFRRDLALGYLPILCDQFSFTTTLTLSMLADQYLVDWLPIRVLARQAGHSQVKVWRDGWRTVQAILWVGFALRTRRIRAWLRH